MTARINNRQELNVERVRLTLLRKDYEAHFNLKIEDLHQRVLPYRNFFTRLEHIFSSKKTGSATSLSGAIQMGVPLLVDRLFLGTKGLILKRLATWASEFAATRISQEIPAETLKKLSNLLPLLTKVPFIKKLLEKI